MKVDVRRKKFMIMSQKQCGNCNCAQRDIQCFGYDNTPDLDALESLGMVRRSYGKVTLQSGSGFEEPYLRRRSRILEAKKRIAQMLRAILRRLTPFILTVAAPAMKSSTIFPLKNAHDFTNCIASVNALQKMPWVTTFVIGGIVRGEMNSIDSSTSLLLIKNIFVDAAFISCVGFNENGIVNNGIPGLSERRAMIEIRAGLFTCGSYQI
jgi:DeoR family fructose operon transcriptional repressor